MWILFGLGLGFVAISLHNMFTLVLSIVYLYVGLVGSKKEESKID